MEKIHSERDVIEFQKRGKMANPPKTVEICMVERSGQASVTYHHCDLIHPEGIEIIWPEAVF